jgi:hypothetical protein
MSAITCSVAVYEIAGMAVCQPRAQSHPTAYDNGFCSRGGANLQILSVQALEIKVSHLLRHPMILVSCVSAKYRGEARFARTWPMRSQPNAMRPGKSKAFPYLQW